MAFDSNPQAVYHGQGFGELREVGSTRFNFTATASNFKSAVTGNSLNMSEFDGKSLVGIKVSGADLTNRKIHWIDPRDVPATAVTAGTAATNANALAVFLSHDGTDDIFLYLARNASGNIVGARSENVGTGTDATIITFFEIF